MGVWYATTLLNPILDWAKEGGTAPRSHLSLVTSVAQPDNIARQLPGLNIEQFLELAQAISLMLRPSDRYSNYETLERFAKNRWLIQSGQLSGLIGKQPKGSLIQWGGFIKPAKKTARACPRR